jgi:hypothetical protein
VRSNIQDFFLDNGLTIMITGVVLLLTGLLILVQHHYTNPLLKQGALVAACIGGGLYVTGRVSVFIASRRARKMRGQLLSESEEKEIQ